MLVAVRSTFYEIGYDTGECQNGLAHMAALLTRWRTEGEGASCDTIVTLINIRILLITSMVIVDATI